MNTIASIALKGSSYNLKEYYLQKYFKDNTVDEKYTTLYSEALSERFTDVVDMIKDDLKFYEDIIEQAERHHISVKVAQQTYQKIP